MTWRRALLGTTALLLALIAALPWLLYAWGLHGIEGRPVPTSHLASIAEQQQAWHNLRGVGPPQVPRLDPYRYLYEFFEAARSPHWRPNRGIQLAWYVASNYLIEHRRNQGGFSWILSGTALTIWLTRHWTTEQLLSRAAELNAQRRARSSPED